MSIWNKILVGFIMVGSLAFFVLGARALKTHQYWRAAALQLQADLAAAEEAEVLLVDGDDTTTGLREAKSAVHALMVDRGRVWRGCTRQAVKPGGNQGVMLSLSMDVPDPEVIRPKTVLYLFEDNDVQDGGGYLGEFSVTATGQGSVQLVPSMALNDRELQRLQNSKGPWSLYEVMPADQRDVLVELDEAEIGAMFPESTAAEYVADRQAAESTDPDAAGPSRQLRDYEILFGEHHKMRSMWTDSMAAANRDLQYLESALADARQQVQFRQDEIDQLTKDVATETKQRDTVAVHRQALETKLADVEADIKGTMESNQAMAGAIAKIQSEAVRRIDERTRRMAQASGPR